jgi:two-component system phosphate regulon sensor histidine kinase PhoR
VHQAVANLVSNAIKYSPTGSSVEVEGRLAGDVVEIEVVDNGPGIPAKHLPRIFERFYRVDKARSRELGGTGLGLALVKHIALAHGGAVDAQSVVGKGSRFTIRLPLADAGKSLLPGMP